MQHKLNPKREAQVLTYTEHVEGCIGLPVVYRNTK